MVRRRPSRKALRRRSFGASQGNDSENQSGKALSPERREIPDGAKSQTALNSERRLTRFGISRLSGFRAVWDFAPYGSLRLAAFTNDNDHTWVKLPRMVIINQQVLSTQLPIEQGTVSRRASHSADGMSMF